MPKLTNSELNKIFSEREKPSGHNIIEHQITGAELYDGISDAPFDSLPAEEKFIYDLIAQTANQALAKHKKKRL